MRLIFIGKSHAFSLLPLAALEQAHDIVGFVEGAPRQAAQARLARLRRTELQRRARRAGRPHLALDKDDPEPLLALLHAAKPDLICIASLSQLLPEAVIALPAHGAINLHPSLLPKYPGPFPVLWQYLAFERTWGVTVHRVDRREDAGAILEQEPFDVEAGTPLPVLLDRAAAIGARLMRKAVDDLAAGTSRPRPQAGERTPRARAVTPDEPLIDWRGWPIERVWHALRGTKPWLNALSHGRYASREFDVLGYTFETSSGEPGTVYEDEQGFYAAHPQGKIRLALDRSWMARARRLLRSA